MLFQITNMLYASLILLVSLGLGFSFRIAENVVFEKTQEVSVVRSKWMFSFFTDLKTYQGYLRKLEINLQRAHTVVDEVIDAYQKLRHPHYSSLYERQKTELNSLNSMYKMTRDEFRDILIIQNQNKVNRLKRAVLPFLGKALSFLTGTLTKKDLKKVYGHINTLSENQEQIMHVLNDTLSIVNVTNVEVRRNRHAIQSMAEMIGKVDSRLVNFTGQLQNWLNHLNSFLLTYLQMDMMITELRESIEKAMFYMDDVKMELDQLALGHLAPTVIHPGELKRILIDIQSKIPSHLTLPAPVENIWYYYRTLTCVTLVNDRRFITMVNLPLLELSSTFEIYQVHNIPLPYPGTKMTATYMLESTNIAVNVKQTQYILLTATDLASCNNPSTKFCTLRSPLFDFGESRLCVIALFRQDEPAVSKDCQTVVKLDTTLPQAVYIPDGNWVVVNANPLLFTIICLGEQTYQVQTRPPVFGLQVAPACEAFADGITLPPFYHRESYYGRARQRNGLLTLQNKTTTLDIWRPMKDFNFTDVTELQDLPDLDEVDDIPIDALKDKLNKLKVPDYSMKSESLWDQIWGYLEYIAIILLFLSIMTLVLCLKYGKGGLSLIHCVQAMGNRKIRGTSTNQTIGQTDVENVVKSTCCAEDQSMEVLPEASRPGRLVLELAAKAN